ncbi:maleylacetoacetate isomerase [Glaciecola petra]|uniref:Maleylacetoacetate isomerase n=1 Tax=Glaciecola petra TaxID=3075602 RepID=A0ABU2ZN78_9ALTE|nr:maleylacetoacetate isomerase [Aestuariibacter sp. P117]MDT0593871.1 maleylacetoacetate isomerase [Aestuariibacter sp. P117]
MSIQLYGYWRSSASYRVRIALNLKHIDYEYVPIHLVKDGGQQKSANYQLLNPAMLVPTLVDQDKDITLNQSLAIIEYLDEVYPGEQTLLPKHKLDRARVRMLAHDIACDIQPLANLRVLHKLRDELKAENEQVNYWAKSFIESGFNALEKRLATRSGKYCFGYELSLADVCLVPQVYNALRFGVKMDHYPILKKISENCQKLPAFVEAAPENQIDAS